MSVVEFERPLLATVLRRLAEPRKFIQVLMGPRQVGKTTLARQAIAQSGLPAYYASADDPGGRDYSWVEANWSTARAMAGDDAGQGRAFLLVLDEIQKVPRWSEIVKQMWDSDTASGAQIKVLLLGSSPLLVQTGLTESLAGRFEVIRTLHWSYGEMREAFGWDLPSFLYFGGYPGAASLINDEERWRGYIQDSLIETTLSRDILLMTRVDKPALLRQLFRLACDYSGQILSYQKMTGQLQDAGNTTTLAHYLQLLSGAGLVTGLQKFSGARVRQRGSSPKLVVLNTALLSAVSRWSYSESRLDLEFWGRLVETAVGAYFANALGPDAELLYWRHRNREVDYVVRSKGEITAVEVKSGRRKQALPGMAAFDEEFGPHHKLLIGGQGLALEDFFSAAPARWLRTPF